ncbi:hypothetical protein MN0502_23970 [Arthrobacter sp. MN05-02]|nr:hypothetical protein MN0502_23970 [Arthrobacter sp. MN05-02]
MRGTRLTKKGLPDTGVAAQQVGGGDLRDSDEEADDGKQQNGSAGRPEGRRSGAVLLRGPLGPEGECCHGGVGRGYGVADQAATASSTAETMASRLFRP